MPVNKGQARVCCHALTDKQMTGTGAASQWNDSTLVDLGELLPVFIPLNNLISPSEGEITHMIKMITFK